MDALITLLCLVFLLFVELHPWDPVLLFPPSTPIPFPPFVGLVFFVALPAGAIPPVILYTIRAMERAPDLFEITLPWRLHLHSTPTPEPTIRVPHSAAAQIPRPSQRRRLPLAEEILAALVGGCVEVLFQTQDDKSTARPRHIFCAALLATAAAALWQRLCATKRERFFYTRSGPRPSSLRRIPWSRIKKMAALTFLSGGWVWAVVFIVASPTSRPAFQARLWMTTVMQGSIILANKLIDSASAIIHKLWRRCMDDPVVALRWLGQEP